MTESNDLHVRRVGKIIESRRSGNKHKTCQWLDLIFFSTNYHFGDPPWLTTNHNDRRNLSCNWVVANSSTFGRNDEEKVGSPIGTQRAGLEIIGNPEKCKYAFPLGFLPMTIGWAGNKSHFFYVFWLYFCPLVKRFPGHIKDTLEHSLYNKVCLALNLNWWDHVRTKAKQLKFVMQISYFERMSIHKW